MRSSLARLLTTVLVVLLPALVAAAPNPLPEMNLQLEIEHLLVGEGGIRPLNEPNPMLATLPGAHHRLVQLGADLQHKLLVVLRYEWVDSSTIGLTLERSVHRGEATAANELPVMTYRMDVLDSWHATVLDDIGTGERLVLRVTPIIRPAVTDEPFDSKRLGMRFAGGPSILFGSRGEDRVIHRAVNVDGAAGLSLGVEGLGVFRMGPRGFPGAVPAGWVRGHQWWVSIGGYELGGWSNEQILPDDPGRPGAGWILYATFEPAGEDDVSFYGAFPIDDD